MDLQDAMIRLAAHTVNLCLYMWMARQGVNGDSCISLMLVHKSRRISQSVLRFVVRVNILDSVERFFVSTGRSMVRYSGSSTIKSIPLTQACQRRPGRHVVWEPRLSHHCQRSYPCNADGFVNIDGKG